MPGRVTKATRVMQRIGPHPRVLVREAQHRAGRTLRRQALRRSYDARIRAVPAGVTLRPPVIDLPPADQLPAELQPCAARIRGEADHILRHEVAYLGSGYVALGDTIDWHRDFKSGYRWPEVFYQDLEVTRLTDDSDAKVPWELSRCHQLLTLARAARLYPEDRERYTTELERQLGSWLDANPAGIGINWVNAMEIGLRAVNILWAIGTLAPERPLGGALAQRLTASLQQHGRHIAANLEGSPALRSNHYLSDLLGLLVLGVALPDDPRARGWVRLACAELEREIVREVHPDGLNFEASLAYHGLVLEIFLIAWREAARGGRPPSQRYRDRVRAMLAACESLRHPDGRVPQIGDNDSGRVLPAGFDRPPTYDPMLWIGAAVTGVRHPGGPAHEEVAWTLGLDAWSAAGSLPPAPAPPAAFPDAGLYVLRGPWAHVVVDCGDVGQHGNGGHSHNDLLSFELSFGVPVVVDSGTYVYTADPTARNAMRATAAHNTVSVAGEEINPFDSARLFVLAAHARPVVEQFRESETEVVLVASHDGYTRLQPPVIHRRTLRLDRGTSTLTVIDDLLGSGPTTAVAALHLAAGARVEAAGPGTFVVTAGDVRAHVGVGDADVEIAEAWVSDRYGRRTLAPVLRLGVEGCLPLRLHCTLQPAERDAR